MLLFKYIYLEIGRQETSHRNESYSSSLSPLFSGMQPLAMESWCFETHKSVPRKCDTLISKDLTTRTLHI